MPPQQNITSLMISAGILILVLAFRWRRMQSARRLRLQTLWIVPVIFFGVAGALFYSAPPTGLVWLASLVALGVGGALGWQRGKLMYIEVDPDTETVTQRGSPAAMLFLVALIAIRFGAREAAAFTQSSLHLNAMAVSDVLIAFALGLITFSRVEIYLRAKRLIEQARSR